MTVTEKQRNDSTKGKMMENNWTGKMWKDHPGSVQLGFYSQSLGRLFLFVVKNFARAKIFAAVTENICRVFHLLVHNFTVQFCSHHCKFCWCPAYKSATRSWTYRSERQRKTFILLQEFKQTKKINRPRRLFASALRSSCCSWTSFTEDHDAPVKLTFDLVDIKRHHFILLDICANF